MNRLKEMCHTAKGARLLAAALLFAAPGLAAGATGFSGRVTQEDGVTGISGVTVEAINPADDSVAYTNTTGGDGSFDVPAAVGTYHLQAVPAGYFPGIRSSHTLTADQYKTINFALQSTGAEAWRDNMSVQNWGATYNFVNSYRLSSNGNVVNMGITHNTTGGNQYLGITRTMTANKTTYPYITVRNKMNLTSGAVNTPVLVFDYPGPWNYSVGVLNSGAQSWPWQDRTHVITYDMAGILFILGDPSAAPAVADQYLDYVIVHSVDRGFAAGQVTGKYGTALPNARVQLRKGSAVVGEALSDAAGNYNIWGAVGSGYNVYVSSNGAEFVSGSVSLTGRTQTTANVSIDTAPPAATSDLWANAVSTGTVDLYWTSPGDDWNQVTLNNSSYTIQHATYTAVNWSTAAAQIILSTTGVAAGASRGYTINNLSANTTHYFRLWTRDAYGTYSALSNGATGVTRIENPTSVYIDEVGSTTILASAYAPVFSGLERGFSGVAIDTSTDFIAWGSTGNYWTGKAPMPTMRSGMAVGVIGGKLYAVGGRDASNTLDQNEEYDPISNVWTTKSPMPTARYYLAAGVIGNKLYAVGGINVSRLTKNEEYDPISDTWVTKAVMPTARASLGAGVAGGKLYVMGGENGGSNNQNEEYDPALNIWATKAAMPAVRYAFGLGTIGGKLYAVGGYYLGNTNKNEEYDPVSNTWATRAVLPTARYYLAAAAIGGKLHAVGGWDGAGYFSQNEEYDPVTNAWATKSAMSASRAFLAACAVGGKLYAVGGNNGGAHMQLVSEYNPGVSRKLSGLRPNGWYQFSAKSRNQAGLVGAQSIPWVSTHTLAAVGLPWWGAPVFSDIQASNFTVNWSSGTPSSYNNPGATYKVQVSTLPDFSALAGNANTSNLYYQFTGLPANATHYARIQAYNSGGMTDYAWLALGSTVTAMETPSSVYFDEVSTRSITVSAYAASLSNLGWGLSGVNLTTGAAYGNWTSGGETWSAKLNMPAPKHGAAAAALGGKIYVMGGTHDGLNYSADTHVYDPAFNTWSARSAMPTARYLLAAAAAGGKIYALGGYNNLAGGVLGVNQEYDPAADAWRNAAPMPTPRERLAAVAAGGKVYALGGFNSLDYTLNEIYDPANNTWTTGIAMPTARKSLAAAYLNGKIYAVGGNGGGYKNVNEEYDLNSKTWSTKAAMPTARSGLAAAVIGGKLYAVSGFDGTYINKSEAYDPNSNTWAAKNPIPVPREGMAYAAAGGRLYAFGGNDGTYLSSTTAYFPGVSKAFTGLQPNTQYSLMVKARNQAGVETGDMGTFNAYTLAVATVPAGPAVQVTSPHDAQVTWSSGSQAGGYNGPNANYRVEASTMPDFSGDLRFQTPWDFTQSYFGGLEPKTTYYFRVQAYNGNNITDYSWTVLGSTRMPAEPLGGTAVSTMAWNAQNFNWARAMVRDSEGNLYLAYLKYYYGKFRVFLSRSADDGATWADTTAAPIETAGDIPSANSYNQYWPALAIDSQDVLHLVWGGTNNQLDPSGGVEPKCAYSSAPAPGNNWNFHTKIPAHTYQGNEFTFNIAVDSNDGLHVVWAGEDAGGAGTASVRYSSRAANGNWTPYVLLNDDALQADFPALAIDDKDGLHVVAKRATVGATNTTPVISYSSRPTAGSWGSWTEIYTGVGGYHQSPPSLTIMADGTRFAAWSSADATYSNSQVKYSAAPPGAAWAPMAYVDTAIPEAPQANPAAAADAVGNVYVIWAGSDTKNPAINLKGSAYNGSAWDNIEGLTDEDSLSQIYPAVRWAGWRNNGGGIDVIWNTWDGISSTATLRVMQGPDVPMSPGWSKTPWAVPAGCGYALNVKQDGAGDFTGIGQALNAVPQELSTTTCVVLRDDGIYGEQVTVQGIKVGRWDEQTSHRLVFMKDPTFISSGPVVSPPLSSTAAFRIFNDSVTVQGITIAPQNTVPYGILASSAVANISGVNIISGGRINIAGLKISSYSAIEYSSVTVESGKGIWLTGLGSAISRSSAAATGTGASALYLSGASSNSIAGSYFSGPAGYGVNFSVGNHFNSIAQSTITADNAAYSGLYIDNSSSNSIDGSNIYNSAGIGANLSSANNNLIQRSFVTGNSASGSALRFTGASSNIVSGSHIQAPLGYGIHLQFGSNYNSINFSTITADAGSQPALYVSGSATTTVTSSYIEGSTAAAVSSVNGITIVRGSMLRGIALKGVGLSLASSQGLFMTSSTVSGGAQGDAIYLAPNISGKVELASNTVNGGKYGLNIAAMGGGGSLAVSSLTFQALTAGATAINFLGGVFMTEMDEVNFESGNIAVNVNAGGLQPASNVFFGHPAGRWGALYENDLLGYINWPGMGALLNAPADGALDVSPAAALHSMVDGGNTAAQYHYQVDTAETMDSQGVAPLYSFDQTVARAFLGAGAFSGQDWTVSIASDAYVYDSTATFVFYSTGTQLSANTQYYWRVRTKTPESGAYGQWTTTSSFITGQMAAAAPVNNLAVTDVALADPTAAGVTINFTLMENNVSTGTTPNGASYNTADWIFVKFSTQAGADGTWNHATLALTGGSVGGGGTLTVAPDGKGAFLDHTSVFPLWESPVSVVWNYGADGVVGGNALVKVFAISMVKVPQGQFVYNAGGIGGGLYNNYGNGSQSNVLSATDRPTGAAAGWPNGYGSFYMMRYELTQGQYADFLNTIPSAAAATRYAADTGSGHQMGSGGVYPDKYSAADRFAAKNYLSPSDLWSFLSWAALRPLTEMEFEKAARDVSGDARKYPWGNTEPDSFTYAPVNEGGTHVRNFMNFYPGTPAKVLDVGRYMSGDIYRTPEQTGASPYGIADLAGNVYEIVINCSYSDLPDNGDGTVAWPAIWPAPDSSEIGLRGGMFTGGSSLGCISQRDNANLSWDARLAAYGGRGGRTP